MDGSHALVSFRHVTKTYDGETLVVRDLDLDIRRGEFLTMLGPSGSGKTTSLMMLAGFESPTEGQILVDGRELGSTPPHKRNIGMVFQDYALFPHMTVMENVAFPLSVRGLGKAEQGERALKALSMVKLEGLGGRKPAQLSGGQQQRVALARALVFAPKIVLMDEPLGALDKQLREHMQLEIKHIHQRLGVTVVYVTHDQSEALTMSDRIAVFNDGVVQQLDTPAELYDCPKNSFVAGFIGENNKLHGIVETLDGAGLCRVKLGSGEVMLARALNVAGVGARTTVSFRPERIRIEAPDENRVNRLHGRVLETIYHGDHVRLRVAVAGNEDFMVKAPVSGARPIPAVGEPVKLAFHAQDCLALDPVK